MQTQSDFELSDTYFGLLAYKTARKKKTSSIVLSHQVCGNLLWQHRKLKQILVLGSEMSLYQILKNADKASEVGRGQIIEMIGEKKTQKTKRWT